MTTWIKSEDLRKSLTEIRASAAANPEPGGHVDKFEPVLMDQILDTMDALWKIARTAKRWQKAPPGRESVQRESELTALLDQLPPA